MTQSAPILAKDPGLLAIFYGPRDERDRPLPVMGWLKNDYRLTSGQGPAKEIFPRHFKPAAAVDTSVFQLALNAEGQAAADGWLKMRERLERHLNEHKLKEVWGYTLIYQAVLAEGVTLDEPALRQLVESAQPLRLANEDASASDSQTTMPLLAQADVVGGRLWLTHVPLKRDGMAAATVYVALGPVEGERTLVQTVLLGANAKLLMPDLIAHKGYHQRRQYRQDETKEQYEQAIKTIYQTINELLKELETNRNKLDQLTTDYNTFLIVVPHMAALYDSLAKQLHNYQWWQKQAKLGEVAEFHHHHLNAAFRELELLVAKGKEALEAARTTVEMVQAKSDRNQAQQQQTLQNWLAIIAVLLAVPQLIDKNAAAAFLLWLGVLPSDSGYNYSLLLAIQCLAMLITGLFVWLAIKAYQRRSRR